MLVALTHSHSPRTCLSFHLLHARCVGLSDAFSLTPTTSLRHPRVVSFKLTYPTLSVHDVLICVESHFGLYISPSSSLSQPECCDSPSCCHRIHFFFVLYIHPLWTISHFFHSSRVRISIYHSPVLFKLRLLLSKHSVPLLAYGIGSVWRRVGEGVTLVQAQKDLVRQPPTKTILKGLLLLLQIREAALAVRQRLLFPLNHPLE